MARGNPYARGGDVMKTRSEKRKEKQAKLAKTNRVIRLKRRLGRIAAKKFAGQEDSHMTALMESYIVRRKAERAAEKAKEEQNAGVSGDHDDEAGSDFVAEGDSEEGGSDYDGEGGSEGSGSDAFSLGSGADDSAFEMEDDEDSEEEVDIATSRRRAAEAKRHQQQEAQQRGQQRSNASRGGFRGGRGGSWNAKREGADEPKRFGGRGGGGGRGGRGGRGGASSHPRGRGSGGRGGQRTVSASSYNQRSRKVPTRSLY